jgi:hypothetical protein
VEPAARFNITETDIYPDPLDPEALKQCGAIGLYGMVKNITEKRIPLGFGTSIEPFTSFFPQQGPNAYLLFRKFRKVFDPNGVSSPGRQVLTEEEYKAFPKEMLDGINSMKKLVTLNPLIGRAIWITVNFMNKMKKMLAKSPGRN